jgi:transposase-like protein
MVEELDEEWWRQYRRGLEVRFAQKEVVVHAQEIRRL